MNLKLIKEERSHSNVKGSSLFSHYINFNLISVHKSKAFEPNKKKKHVSQSAEPTFQSQHIVHIHLTTFHPKVDQSLYQKS